MTDDNDIIGDTRGGYSLPIGFFGELAPGETATLECQQIPPIGFVGYEFSVPNTGAPGTFGIEDIVTAGRGNFTSDGAVPGSAFFPGQGALRLAMHPTTPADPSPEVEVTNYTDKPQVFRAVLVGDCPPLPMEVNRSLLGLHDPDVEPGQTTCITVVPQVVCRIRSILVDYITADSFNLCGVRLGKTEVGAMSAAGVPLSMMGVEVKGWPRAHEIFGQQEDGPDLWDGPWLTVAPGQNVSLLVENRTRKPVRFRGVFRVELLPPTDEELRLAGVRR